MMGASVSPVFALITTGEDYLFVKLDRFSLQYALSDKFTLNSLNAAAGAASSGTLSTGEGNELYQVAQILKQLAAV
ncbi:MAG: hypothetical protein JOZ78_01320 [Chroococcidiopsidaceae cyanobacterium CP_BM_ER_R8_30]|nr:hypothetical protein [Chroococcidiopsidaceae cyanobacterium CP_BM_ER_R8_30]